MAHRVTRRQEGGALRRPASALSRGGRDALARWRATRSSRSTPIRAARRTCSLRSTTRPPASSCSRRPSSASSSTSRRSRRRRTRTARCSSRSSPRSCRSGLLEPPGAQGADIVCGEGQGIGNALEFRRALCRALRDEAEIHPPDAGPALRHDGRRGGQARLRADAFDARAAYPPREGDLQHLHQFRPLLARLHRAHDAARRDRAARSSRKPTMRAPASSPTRLPKVPGVEVLNEAFFNEFTVKLPKPAAADRRGACGEGHHGRRAGVAAPARSPGSTTSSSSRRRRR